MMYDLNNYDSFLNYLDSLKDLKYKEFSLKTIPVKNIIGIIKRINIDRSSVCMI